MLGSGIIRPPRRLLDWQNASGNDMQGIAADPLFVNPSGDDAVQGYNATANNGNGFDGGSDDNFLLSQHSLAIGAALASVAPSTDLLGQTRTVPIDMGAYAFTGSNTDTTRPTITGTTPAGINTSGSLTSLSSITVTFSEAVNPVDAGAVAEYDLRSAGPDGNFNTGDDILYPITPTYIPGNTFVTLNFSGAPLPSGTYRLEIFSARATPPSTTCRAWRLDGGSGGSYIRTFTIASAAPTGAFRQREYLKL